ncbi:hypothetical protein D9756_009545 [Leucocoprinus leucothites]|uniref:Uncharacterized protein n=1 Tax=Leucocoprinus leucothites TaxID=201217 RepID=A0A8H5FTX6_9AGAR|nr:hypothetical protein D9756_009545 [Leucoagaricus leucothites]
MSESQPVLISYLRLPPNEQLFSRLKEILLLLREKLEHLTLALAVPQDPDSPFVLPKEVNKALKPLRTAASGQSIALGNVLFQTRLFANKTLQLVDTLEAADSKVEKPDVIEKLIYNAKTAVESCETAAKEMEEVSELTTSTIQSLRPVIDKTSNNASAAVFTEENSQVVNELLKATREGSTLFRQTGQYYRDAGEHFRDDEALRANPPSPEEINVVRQRWTAFVTSLGDYEADLSKIGAAIRLGPKVHEARRLGRLWSRFGKTSTQDRTTTPAQPRTILDANTSDHAPARPRERNVSFLRSIWQWILAHFSTKKNK